MQLHGVRMRTFHWVMLCFAFAALIGILAMAEAAEAADAKRPAAFAICAACHSTQPGKTIFGPSLAGVASRKAGSLPGYVYSDALRKSGLTWDAGNLDQWLTSPQKTVPGTKMPFAGIADPAKRKEVVDYLLTLK